MDFYSVIMDFFWVSVILFVAKIIREHEMCIRDRWCTGPPSGRPVFGAFPPRWLCVLPYRSLLLQQHTILQKEKDSQENGAELSKQ